jgi:hypothetical protein
MGYYIETPWPKNKAHLICEAVPEAKIIPGPESFEQYPPDVGLICVVDNGLFEAAAFCYSPREFAEFARSNDFRPKVWLTMPRKKAEELSGFGKDESK